MKNERMKILELLTEEAIDTHEAVQLLKAVRSIDSSENVNDEIRWGKICKILEMVEEGEISAKRAAKFIKPLKIATSLEDEYEEVLVPHVLTMIEDGEIDADEAAEIFKALKTFSNLQGNYDYDYIDELSKQFYKDSMRFPEDFSERFNAAFKDVEPELDAAAKEVLGAVASLLDDVSQSLKGKNN